MRQITDIVLHVLILHQLTSNLTLLTIKGWSDQIYTNVLVWTLQKVDVTGNKFEHYCNYEPRELTQLLG